MLIKILEHNFTDDTSLWIFHIQNRVVDHPPSPGHPCRFCAYFQLRGNNLTRGLSLMTVYVMNIIIFDGWLHDGYDLFFLLYILIY